MDMKGYKIKQITDASPALFPANYGRVHVFFEKLQYVQQKPDKQIKVHVHVHDTCIWSNNSECVDKASSAIQ